MDQSLLIGIDVGGTFTDAVAVSGGEVRATAKVPTRPEDLATSVLGALDRVLDRVDARRVARLGLSTTLLTNLVAQGRTPPVALFLLPGPGRRADRLQLPGRAWILQGAVDFAGRETRPLDEDEVVAALEEARAAGYRHLAVVGKFSGRNPVHEDRVAELAARHDPTARVLTGHRVTGRLNFPRRAAACALRIMLEEPYRDFLEQLVAAFRGRGLDCPVAVLKADGGTLPLTEAENAPLHSVFSGPAASTMGVLAQRPPGATSVVVDVGGSTTDLALILDGRPLFSSRGARLAGQLLPFRAFAVRSLPIGGDSRLVVEEGRLAVAPTREGPARALGGPAATLTDALQVLGHESLGDADASRQALRELSAPLGLSGEEGAQQAVDAALARLRRGILEMLRAWRSERVYRIWQWKRRSERHPDHLIGVGAGAAALVPLLAERLAARVSIPDHAPVANALGAALARTTWSTTVRVDTHRRRIHWLEAGRTEELGPGDWNMEIVRAMTARRWRERGVELGVERLDDEPEETLAEVFNVVGGWERLGRIYDLALERRCGLVEEWPR